MAFCHATSGMLCIIFLPIKSNDMNRLKLTRARWHLGHCARSTLGSSLVILACTHLQAQYAVGTAGGDGSGAGGTTAFTIGQVAYTNFNGEGGTISLGVQQPNLILTVGIHDLEVTLEAAVFPNPAQSSTSLQLDGVNSASIGKGLTYGLFDLQGQLISEQPIQSRLTTIPMEHLADGMYILQVKRDHMPFKTFKIFKTN